MPELLIPILFSFLTYLYFTMKQPKIPTEKSIPKVKVEQPVAQASTETKTKKVNAVKATKKPKTNSPKSAPKAKNEQLDAVVVPEEKSKNPSSPQFPTAVAKVVSPKRASTQEMAMSERVGLTAGSVWRYLSENGMSPVAKLVRELPEEEKIIQRSIGWLAQEGKITLTTIDNVETIGLAG